MRLASRMDMAMRILLDVLLADFAGSGFREGEQAAEENVLCDGQLLEYLGTVHLDHAFVDLGPGFCTGNVVEHGRVPAQRGRLDRVDKLDAGEVHELWRELVDNLCVVDGFGSQMLVIAELAGAPEKGEEVVVIQAPHTVTAGRLEPIRRLDIPHHLDISPKHTEDDGRAVLGQTQDAQFAQAESACMARARAREEKSSRVQVRAQERVCGQQR